MILRLNKEAASCAGVLIGNGTTADFEVWIDEPIVAAAAGQKPVFAVKVYSSPAGPAVGELKFDLSDPAIMAELARVSSIDPDVEVRRSFGDRLFKALFDKDVGDAWRASWGRVDGKEFDGLRLRLTINIPELSAPPWELLWDSTKDSAQKYRWPPTFQMSLRSGATEALWGRCWRERRVEDSESRPLYLDGNLIAKTDGSTLSK